MLTETVDVETERSLGYATLRRARASIVWIAGRGKCAAMFMLHLTSISADPILCPILRPQFDDGYADPARQGYA